MIGIVGKDVGKGEKRYVNTIQINDFTQTPIVGKAM